MTTSVDKIINIALSYLPIVVWRSVKGAGSFLTFDMGDVIEETRGKSSLSKRGDLHLWIYLCDWVLFHDGQEILNSAEEDNEIFETHLKNITGLPLISVKEVSTESSVEFGFGENYKLLVTANTDAYETDDDLFILYIFGKPEISYSLEKGFYID